MIRIGMEFRDFGFSCLDFTSIEDGNPGCGGTQYEFALLAHHLIKSGFDCEIVFFHSNDNFFNPKIKDVKVKSLNDIPKAANDYKIDILIFWPTHDQEWYDNLDQYCIKSIAWAHNFLTFKEIKWIKKCKNVIKVVCVGQEQYELLCGEDIFERCTFISNMFDFKIDGNLPLTNKKNSVCILGSLIKAKGFHLLAKKWKHIVNKVPDCELFIIGGGNLWNNKVKLGKHGLAEQKYEDAFLKYLIDKNGEILSSVHFLGNLGKEKEEIIKECKVGVVNPNGIETFCLSAIEMEALGVPVCSKKKNGLINSVRNKKTGLLSKTTNGLSRNIIKLLKSDEYSKTLGINGIEYAKQFAGDILIKEWALLLSSVHAGSNFKKSVSIHFFTRMKFIRYFIHLLRKVIILRFIPTPFQINSFYLAIKSKLAKIKNRVLTSN